MSGHVPKFRAANAENFTEAFTLARNGKSGSGDSAASLEDANSIPLRNPRGRGGAASGVPPRRGSGGGSGSFERELSDPPPPRRVSGSNEKESVSNRSSQDGGMLGSDRPSPPARRGAKADNSSRGRGGGHEGSSRGGRNSRLNDDSPGAGHISKFGDWNNSTDAGEPNYTVMFTAASAVRKTGTTGDLPVKPVGASGDLHRNSNGKKHTSSWWCFG